MYVATFYSYKGGVGRTMALINVAILLSLAGKRVLIVDFDLEAPGIPSFDLFRCAGSRAGIVDYVCAFRDTGRAPDVSDFIVRCEDGDKPPIWVMPAGRHTQPGYADKLYSIDWKDLYENHDGFVMFEDMRAQWAEHDAEFDYVLIDSRTGHTDVGGICTRQLPDGVVVMFLPNEQNIEGLKPIVESIREEDGSIRGHRIDLHFCPSNVPELDDENEILSSMLDLAQDSLGPPATIIRHYNSLDLLRQPAFVACRPRSSLARQYQELMHAVIARNLADEMGAEWALRGMPERYEQVRREGDQIALFEIEEMAARIGWLHTENGKLCWLLSILYSRMGAIEDELGALTGAIDHDYERSRALIRRARLLSSLGRKEPALDDLDRVLTSGAVTVFEIQPAIDLLRAIKPDAWIEPIQRAIAQVQTTDLGIITLIRSLMTERDKLPLAIEVSRQVLTTLPESARGRIRSFLILSLIGQGHFELAMDTIGEDAKILADDTADDLFNFAIAKWGAEDVAPVEFFARFLEVLDRYKPTAGANVYQCVAVAHMVLGQHEAAANALEIARSRARLGDRDFSCWRYLEVSGRAMIDDLAAMEKLVGQTPPPEPRFFAEVRRDAIDRP